MADQDQSIRAVYSTAEQKRQSVESSWDSNSATYQENLLAAISLYEQCLSIADRISLFSPNESLEDIASVDLQYLLLHYRVADLCLKINGRNRKANLQRGQAELGRYLKQLDHYDILPKSDATLLELYQESPNTFSTASTADAAARRETKIKRFKEEKELKKKLEYLQQNPSVLENDDAAYRDLQLTNIAYCTHQSFQSLESIAQELHILSLAPAELPPGPSERAEDGRERNSRHANGYSERLDAPLSHLSAGMRGPLLDSKGKPMRPFTLLDNRQRMQDGVFRPDHSLPTMTIDEYLEEERKRGGMIDGGGPQSAMRPEPDEDDIEKADQDTMKAREWDEFVEANPKGSGNTLNRG